MKYFQFVTVVTLLALYPLASANAQAVLDQSDTAGISGVTSQSALGQTFTVGITGTLSSVELYLYPSGYPIDAQIASTIDGVPTNTILGQSTVDPAVNGWISFNFTTGIPVHAGEVLAIELPPTPTTFTWGSDSVGTYSGGLAYIDFSKWVPLQATLGPAYPPDFKFQTFVIPTPEPSGLALLACGAAGLLLWAARRQFAGRSHFPAAVR